MKKPLCTALVAALVITAPGPLATSAAAQVFAASSRVVPVTMSLSVTGSAANTTFSAPTTLLALPGTPAMLGVQAQAPTLIPVASAVAQPIIAWPVAAAQPIVALAKPIAGSANVAALATFMQPAAARSADAAALGRIFDYSLSAASTDESSVLANPASAPSRLSAAGALAAKGPAAVSFKKDGSNGGDMATIGLIGALWTFITAYLFSPTFKASVKRLEEEREIARKIKREDRELERAVARDMAKARELEREIARDWREIKRKDREREREMVREIKRKDRELERAVARDMARWRM